ncbi:CENP-B N-terminal DNA-binding domain [Popillia japonica]|uniref:CENP-B N-terminal DNA-binding domain n=1 Tax=Popillia japonica TaxID=7064 RepID=A0AAW1MZG1_POPJA
MSNKYIRPRNARKYAAFQQENLEKGIADVADGKLSIRVAAEIYFVSKSTIHRKYYGENSRRYGGQTVFSVTLANVPPDNIINFDETNMTDDPGQQTVIVTKRGKAFSKNY